MTKLKTDWIAKYTDVRKLVELREKALRMGETAVADLMAARITELRGAPVARGEKHVTSEQLINEGLHFEHLHRETGRYAYRMAIAQAGREGGPLFNAWYNRIIYAMGAAHISGHEVTALRWNSHDSIERRLLEGRTLEWFQERWEHYRDVIEAS